MSRPTRVRLRLPSNNNIIAVAFASNLDNLSAAQVSI